MVLAQANPPARLVGSVTHLGFKRGCYKLIVENFGCLEKDRVHETNTFEIGGFKWRLGLKLGFVNSCPIDRLRVFLFSCNDVAVYADVILTVGNETQAASAGSKRKSKVASPFCTIERQIVFTSELVLSNGESESNDSLVIAVDLKNIRTASESEQRSARTHGRTVHLEVINDESIKQELNGSARFGIASQDRRRNSDVCSQSLGHLWAQQAPDCRYWLCQRSPDGRLSVKKCLNYTDPLERFDDICDDSRGGFPWVTLFKEQKKSYEEFRPVDDNTMVVFCKLYEATYKDCSYTGHLFIQRTAPCPELIQRISEEMAHLGEDQECDAYLEGEGQQIKDIAWDKSLEQCGLQSGAVVIARVRNVEEQRVSAKSVQLALQGIRDEAEDVAHRSDVAETSNCDQSSEKDSTLGNAKSCPDKSVRVASDCTGTSSGSKMSTSEALSMMDNKSTTYFQTNSRLSSDDKCQTQSIKKPCEHCHVPSAETLPFGNKKYSSIQDCSTRTTDRVQTQKRCADSRPYEDVEKVAVGDWNAENVDMIHIEMKKLQEAMVMNINKGAAEAFASQLREVTRRLSGQC